MTRKMGTRILSVALAIILIGLLSGLLGEPVKGENVTEVRLTTDPAAQTDPDMYGSRIVWHDIRNGNWDIYLCDLGGNCNTQVTTNASNQMYPAIYGNRIVYQDDRNGDWDIYRYDLQAKIEIRVTNSTANQQYPAIYGNHVVYQDDRNGNWDIYRYDLENNTETRITSSLMNHNPAIYGNRIVYTKTRVEYSKVYYSGIYMVDLSNGYESFIYGGTSSLWDLAPAMYGDRLVWVYQDFVSPAGYYEKNIYYKDLANLAAGASRITTNTATQEAPDIYANRIVWQDNRNGNWDIYMYNLDTGMETQITNSTANQQNPAVYGGGPIIYTDNRNGNWDIYYAELGVPIPISTGGSGGSGTPVPTGSSGSSSPTKTGTLYVASYPPGATILMNGTERGYTNQLVTNVPSGLRNLTLSKEGYQPYTTIVNVPAGDIKVLAPITLTKGSGPIPPRGTGILYVASYPTGATILINGSIYGKTNQFVYNVPSGSQNLTLTKDRYQPYTTMVNVPVGDRKILAPITLSPSQSVGDCPPPCITGGYLGSCVCPIGY